MDAIKKKMQAMKVEKDNAMDRSDVCEQAAKDAKVKNKSSPILKQTTYKQKNLIIKKWFSDDIVQVRAAKAEEEVAELVKKSQQLEVELDKTQEELMTTTEKLKDKEHALAAAELEVNSLNRRVQSIEGDLETCEDKLLMASQKLDKAATAADDSDRMRKVLESRAVSDEDRMVKLEDELKAARNQAEDADKKYDEVARKLAQVISTGQSYLPPGLPVRAWARWRRTWSGPRRGPRWGRPRPWSWRRSSGWWPTT